MDKFEPVSFRDALKDALEDPKFKKEYDSLELEYSIIEQVLKKRLDQGLTQKELAEKIGTKQSAIARLESGNSNPSVAFLNKISRALGGKLQVTI